MLWAGRDRIWVEINIPSVAGLVSVVNAVYFSVHHVQDSVNMLCCGTLSIEISRWDGDDSYSRCVEVSRTQPPDTVLSPRVRPKLDRGDHLQRPEPLPSLPGYLHFGIFTGEETWPILSIGLSLACQIGSRSAPLALSPSNGRSRMEYTDDRQSSFVDAAVRFIGCSAAVPAIGLETPKTIDMAQCDIRT